MATALRGSGVVQAVQERLCVADSTARTVCTVGNGEVRAPCADQTPCPSVPRKDPKTPGLCLAQLSHPG